MIEATFRAETTARESKGMNRNRLPKKEMRETPKSETGGQESHPPCCHGACGNFATFCPPIHHRYENWGAGVLIINIIMIIKIEL